MRLVVAWYQENLAWLDEYLARRDPRNGVTVYCKSSDLSLPEETERMCTTDRLPNVGREAHTYLHHICENYDALDDVTLFVQGDPSAHMDSIGRRRHVLVDALLNDSSWYEEGPLLNGTLDESRPPRFHERVDVRRAGRLLLGEDGDLPSYRFSAGAQYVVRKETILRRPLTFWFELRDMVARGDRVNAWEVERLWPLIFGFKKT
jgi:hypothetical protein